MDIKDFFEMQKKYESDYLEQKPISNEMKTQQLALCAHSEISSMLSKTNLKCFYFIRCPSICWPRPVQN